MGELNEARLLAVRSLLQRAPDFAVQSLSSLLASDTSDDRSLELVRRLVGAEAQDRRLRNLTFEPLAVLCKTSTTVPHLSFPPTTPVLLWQALKAQEPSLAARLHDAAEQEASQRAILTLMDTICAAAAERLQTRATPAFAALADMLDTSPNGCAQVIAILTITPDLRWALAKAPAWLGSRDPADSAAIRVAFRTASEKCPEAGFVYMEVLFAAIEQPASILKLMSMVMDRPSDRFLAVSELGSIGERLLDCVDRHVAVIQEFDSRRGLEGGVAAGAAAEAATVIMSEFETNIAMQREGVWGARIVRQRRALSVAMETRLQEVETAMAAALPVKTVRMHGKKLRGPPYLANPPEQPATDKLLSLAALLSCCRTASQANGFGALRTKIIETQDQALETYIQEVLDLMKRGEARVEIARAYLDVAAEVFGLIRDPKAADLVRRRIVAASAAAA